MSTYASALSGEDSLHEASHTSYQPVFGTGSQRNIVAFCDLQPRYVLMSVLMYCNRGVWQLYEALWRLDYTHDCTHGMGDDLKSVMQSAYFRAAEGQDDGDQAASPDWITQTNEVMLCTVGSCGSM